MPTTPKREWDRENWKRNRRFNTRAIVAFQEYIRDIGLPRSDRALLATMICAVAPTLNAAFDRARFLEGCGLTNSDIIGDSANGPVS